MDSILIDPSLMSVVKTIISIFQDTTNYSSSNLAAQPCLKSEVAPSLQHKKLRANKTYFLSREIEQYMSELIDKYQIQDPSNYKVPTHNDVDNLEVLFYVLREQLRQEQKDLDMTLQPNKLNMCSLQSLLTRECEDSKVYCATLQETTVLTFEMLQSDINAKRVFENQFISALAMDLSLNLEQINIISIKKGSIKVVFQIVDQTGAIHENTDLVQLQKQFPGSLPVLKLHQLFQRTALNVADFDPRFNKEWVGRGKTVRGPQNNQLEYHYPNGWKGYGLKVTGIYGQNDNWLAKNQNPEEWYVLFHGTSADALNPIMSQRKVGGLKAGETQCFHASSCQKTNQIIGHGVYFSSRIEACEKYALSKLSPINVGNKQYLVVFQTRVNPSTLKYCGGIVFVVNQSCDIRPYRILLKQT